MRAALVLTFLVISPSTSVADERNARPEGAQLRVLTLNMYGLRYPPRLGWIADRSNCSGRFSAVGARIRDADPPYDIVAIQELYRIPDLHTITCDSTDFLNALEKNSDRFKASQRILFVPNGEKWKLEMDGGIGLITSHSIEEFDALRFVGAGGPFLAARGVLYARIALTSSPVRVDTYVVHLSPGRQNARQRRRELQRLAELIRAKSSASRNPVVVLGDFNIEGTPGIDGEYESILGILGTPRDLWREGDRSGTGYTYDCLRNALAAMRRCTDQARIDYVWIMNNHGLNKSNYNLKLIKHAQIIEWLTDQPNPFPVSDHYGVETFLSIEHKD
jgi:endonuclease/exonuclease/phosphatase family metal-dependent hydrolase